MKRRIKALFLAVMMVATLVWTEMPTVNAANEGGLSISKETVQVGDEFTVSATIPAQTELCGTMGGRILFNSDAFELTKLDAPKITDVSITTSDVATANEKARFNFTGDHIEGDGFSLAEGYTVTATFTVKEGATGAYEFEIYELYAYDEIAIDYIYNAEAGTTASVSVVIPATKVSLNKTELSLKEAETEILTATVTPATTTDIATWESADKDIATVDSTGKVTAVKPGTTTVTVKVGTLSATCEVVVSCAHANAKTIQAKPSTCTEQGNEEYTYCEDCNKVTSGSNEKLPLAKHTLDHVEAKEPECEVAGNIEYWKCSVCNKFFKDAEASEEIIGQETLVKPAPGHKDSGKWDGDDKKHWKPCGGCGVMYKYDEGSHQYGDKSFNEEEHWDVCTVCQRETTRVKHAGGTATCQEKAVCEACGTAYGELGVHEYIEKVEERYLVSAATCTTKAVYKKSCELCGNAHDTDTFETGDVLGHDFAETYSADETHHWYACTRKDCKEVDKKAEHTGGSSTCLEKATCTVCEAKYSDVGSHDYVEKVDAKYLLSAATCTEKAVYKKSCSVCEEAHATETFIYGEALNHAFSSEYTTDGTHHWHACTREGCTAVDGKAEHAGGTATCLKKAECTECQVEYGELGVHVYEESVEAKHLKSAATCTEKAVYYKSCEVCDKTNESETFAYGEALNHAFSSEYTTDGTHHWHACTREGCTAVDGKAEHAGGTATCLKKAECTECQIEYGELGAHVYEESAEAKHLKSVATCKEEAVYYKSCEVCDKTHESETFTYGEINPANHTGETEIKDAKEAKCFEEGFTGDTYCKACGEKVADGKEIEKLPHNITEWEVTKQPTTGETGSKTGYCVNKDAGCTVKHEVEIAKLVATGGTVSAEVKGGASTTVVVDSVIVSENSNVNENVILQVEDVTDVVPEKEVTEMKETAEKAGVVTEKHQMLSILDMSMILRETTTKNESVEDTEFELEGKVQIKLQISEEITKNYENLVLLHVKDDGTVEEVPFTVDGNNVATFVAEGFSYYVFSGTAKATSEGITPGEGSTPGAGSTNPGTGDEAVVTTWIVLAACAMLVVVFAAKKQKRMF